MQLEYKYIRFEELEKPALGNEGRCFRCEEKDGAVMGIVQKHLRYDKYIYIPNQIEMAVISERDLLDIAHFIKQLMDERGKHGHR